jgi:hypothetical protein
MVLGEEVVQLYFAVEIEEEEQMSVLALGWMYFLEREHSDEQFFVGLVLICLLALLAPSCQQTKW